MLRERYPAIQDRGRLVRIAKALEFHLWARADGNRIGYADASTLRARIRRLIAELHQQGRGNGIC